MSVVRVERIASQWDRVPVHSDSDHPAPGPAGDRPKRAKRLSLQSWVILFLSSDIVLLGALGIAPTWSGNLFLPDLLPVLFERQLEAVASGLGIFIVTARSARLYKSSRVLDQRTSLRRVFLVLLLTFAALMALAAASKTTHVYSRLWFFTWLSMSFVLIPSFRMLALYWARRALRDGSYVHKALSVGIGCEPLTPELITQASKGLVRADSMVRLKSIDELPQLAERVSREAIDKVYLNTPWELSPRISASLDALKSLSADVYLVPQAPQLANGVLGVRQIGGNVTLHIGNRPIDGWNYWLKRMQDVTVALLALMLLSPLLLLVAILIRIESRGPIIFRQTRMGFNGGTFELWKFRSMYQKDTDPDAVVQTGRNDPRVTRVGRFIRRTSIDELPQLCNVLQGTMSIVGPRPHALKTTAEGKMLADAMDGYAARHRVKPGLTGWAQVHGLRGEIRSIAQLKQRVHYDREYIAHWSMVLDIKIILMTLTRIASDPNAY